MDPVRTLVDVKKSVETKPNFPLRILLRELPSGRTLEFSCSERQSGALWSGVGLLLALPLGVTRPGAFHGMALRRVRRSKIPSGIIWWGSRAESLAPSFGSTSSGALRIGVREVLPRDTGLAGFTPCGAVQCGVIRCGTFCSPLLARGARTPL